MLGWQRPEGVGAEKGGPAAKNNVRPLSLTRGARDDVLDCECKSEPARGPHAPPTLVEMLAGGPAPTVNDVGGIALGANQVAEGPRRSVRRAIERNPLRFVCHEDEQRTQTSTGAALFPSPNGNYFLRAVIGCR
jgi:hypothetical protein